MGFLLDIIADPHITIRAKKKGVILVTPQLLYNKGTVDDLPQKCVKVHWLLTFPDNCVWATTKPT